MADSLHVSVEFPRGIRAQDHSVAACLRYTARRLREAQACAALEGCLAS
jgi:hypothetical protein